MDMCPSMKKLIADLRGGKPEDAAFRDYCWSKSVLPIQKKVFANDPPPFRRPSCYPESAIAGITEAVRAGSSDEISEAAFWSGLDVDNLCFRVMLKHERPTAADLVKAMGMDDRVTAARIIGFERVAAMLVSP